VIPRKTTPRKVRGSWFGSGTSTPSTSARPLQRGSSPQKGTLATLSAYIRSENFEERGYLDLAVLEYTKRQA
jgi:hypothetical protein